MSKPRIAVTRPVCDGGDMTRLFFHIVLWRAGAKPVFVTPDEPVNMDGFDGLIISGGSDVEPARYGEPLDDLVDYDLDRDQFEFDMLAAALKAGKPVFGICRGMQLINIHIGGTLFTDLKKLFDAFYMPQSFFGKAFYRKTIFVQARTVLNDSDSDTPLRVNSIHHQSINTLGAGLSIIARDDHGIVQAVENKNAQIFGVQWHPEYLFYRREQQKIFNDFIARVQC